MDMSEIKRALDEAFGKYKGDLDALRVNVLDLGQKFAGLSEGRGSGSRGRESLGALLRKSDFAERWRDGNGERSIKIAFDDFDVKADSILGVGTGAYPVQPVQQLVEPIVLPRFWSSLVSVPVNTNAVETIESTFENNAGPQQGEGVLKPQSGTSFTPVLWPTQTIAHWELASRQVINDVAQLGAFVDLQMREGLQAKIDAQVIAGDGLGFNLKGIMTGGTNVDGTTDVALDSVVLAVANLQSQGATKVVVGLNPLDVASMRIAKASGSGSYLLDPLAALAGVPGAVFVPVAAIPLGSYVAVATSQGAYVGLRQGVTLEVSREDADNFRRNMVTLLVEARLALVIARPGLCQYGSLVAPPPPPLATKAKSAA